MERQVARRLRSSSPRSAPSPSHRSARTDLRFLDTTPEPGFRRSAQLPPTRAARTPRSRGIFFPATEPPKQNGARHKADFSIVALAVVVVAIASALILGAPTAISGGAINANPGPAIVGAASVPPAFIASSRVR